MKNLNINSEERDLIVAGLNMRICRIETATNSVRASTARQRGHDHMVMPLNESQQTIIARSKALIEKVLSIPVESAS